ncbi:MAG: type I-MYXAN CRISPR-associated Cas8a1/Cmx1 [Gammaproteobacteria bacterium]|nr:type I-MYXAN CRISPR-associated Cas8a1/Cmx1 [Gammaproteobacteria bacterium]
MAELNWSLGAPGLTAFDRCGIGAMAATINSARQDGVDLGPLDASFDRDFVVLRWPDDVPARDALAKLIEFAWQTRQPTSSEGLGVLYLPAVHRGSAKDSYADRLLENNGILSTFLQHARSQPKTKPPTRKWIAFHEGRSLEVRFVEPKTKLKHVSDFSGKLFDRQGRDRARVGLAQYIMPGGTARHGGEESWTGSAIQAVPLFFAPIGCFFLRAQESSWVVVVPDVTDLAAFASVRPLVGIGWKEAEVRSLEDAGLRIAVAYRTQTTTRRLALRGFEVLRVGRVAWNKQQRVRSHFCRLRPGMKELDEFETVLRHLSNRYRTRKDGEGDFVSVPTPRGRIAANLVHGHYWYRSLFDIPKEDREEVKNLSRRNESEERAWFRLVGYERRALTAIAEELPMDADRELDRLFQHAIHEAMARRFRQEAEYAKRGARSIQDRWDDFRESSRRLFSRSNTRSTLRTAIAGFFAEAGGSRTLRENAQAIWAFIDSPATWRRARDLALFSVVTYQRKADPEEGEAEKG